MRENGAGLHPDQVLFKGLVQAIRSALNLPQMLNLVLDLLINSVNAEVGVILLKDKGQFVPRAGLGLSDRALRDVRIDGRPLLEILGEKTGPFVIPDLLQIRDLRAPDKQVLHSLLSAPLVSHGGAQTGLIILANKSASSSVTIFSPEDAATIGSIVSEVSVVIENALLYEEVSNLKNYNESILNSLPSGIVTTDLEGSIVTVNKGAEFILNISGASYAGQNVSVLFGKVLNSDFDIMRYIRTGENIINYEISMEKGGGDIVVLGVSVSVLKNSRNKIIGSAIHITDFTQKKFLESQVARTEQLAALGEMSAGVAHEIRNPLTSIQGFTQLLPQKGGDPKFMEKYIEIVTRETSRLNGIVERFLAFARPREAGFRECNLTDIVQNALSLLHYQLEKGGIRLEKRMSDLPPVKGDWQQLEQVFINIILNAIQVMEKPEKCLQLTTGSLLKRLLDNRYKEFVAVRIADNGPGIPPDRVDRIFNPFYTTRTDGTGLGLSITSQIIEKHDGSIEVNSRPGEGTVFTVYLPAVER